MIDFDALTLESGHALQPRWKTIDLGDGNSFDVELHPPSFSHRATDQKSDGCKINRITRHVRNWRHVTDSTGEEMLFSRNALVALCEANATAFALIQAAADELY